MTLPAGRRHHRVTFDTPTTVQAANGQRVVTWVPGYSCWAMVRPVSGRERLVADQVLPDHDSRITVLWCSEMAAITAKHRVRCGSTIYNIVHIPPRAGGEVDCEILCQAGTNAG